MNNSRIKKIIPFTVVSKRIKYLVINLTEVQDLYTRDFPGGPVGKTPCSQCRGPGFDPWSGN